MGTSQRGVTPGPHGDQLRNEQMTNQIKWDVTKLWLGLLVEIFVLYDGCELRCDSWEAIGCHMKPSGARSW